MLQRTPQLLSAYVTRDLPPGALPKPTLPTPLYTPLNPPLATNPFCDCTRVLIVSSGNKRKSTAIPDIAPA